MMRGFRQKLFLASALVSTVCFSAAKANDIVPAHTPIVQKANPDDDEVEVLSKDTDENIKKANELHQQALEKLKANSVEQAIALDEQATKIAPHYWLPHAALAYLYSNNSGNGPALEQAAWAIKCEHPPLADTTHAILMGTMRAFSPAEAEYKRLLAADPTSWRAKVGLAQCLMNRGETKAGLALLDELNTPQLTDPAALLIVGSCYNKIGELEKAKDVLKRGLANNPIPTVNDKLLVQLFEVAVNTDDRPLISELKPKVSSKLDSRQRSWLRLSSIRLAQTPVDARLALQLASTETVTDQEFRLYANIFQADATAKPAEKTEWLKLAKEAMVKAFDYKQSLENKILLASFDEQLGDKAVAYKLLRTPAVIDQTERDSDIYLAGYYKKMRKAEDEPLATLFVADGTGYKSFAQSVDFQIPAANCKCKVNSAKSLLKSLPGVFDVVVGPGDKPVATVIFDPRKITRQAMFENPKLKNFKEKLEVSNEKPIASLAELAQIFAKEEVGPLAYSPSITFVALQYPTVEDANTKLSVGTKPAI
jgi:tetratricopeptide (TPR) repeat protein